MTSENVHMLSPPIDLLRPIAVTRIPMARDVIFQPKVDGWRACVFVSAGQVKIQARSGRLITASFPELVAALGALSEGSVIDGEVVCWVSDGQEEPRLDFTALSRTPASRRTIQGVVQFLGFDLLCDRGTDIRGLPLSERWPRLLATLNGAPGRVQPIASTTDRAEAELWAQALVPLGFEGLVAKRLSGAYTQRPSTWWKQRYRDTVDGTVVDVVGLSALRLRLDDGREVTTRPLRPAQVHQLADVLAEHGETGNPVRVEVQIGTGRHGQVDFVRVRADE